MIEEGKTFSGISPTEFGRINKLANEASLMALVTAIAECNDGRSISFVLEKATNG